ncbi:MAG: hypothetical protein A2Y82_05570 [Candidatus Buchananbacteria bacterium RBG_13_36_9]|uniref:Uncharacterized protein n=1 Tax=Candidatus Buchananbacteria bacterium RBG_13_36_9 TaxID=1797530 RepID=A0A1G1XPK6_9BACT|nr:MAG: hypothetical protein A2Y82_05570 [Candidatus Buchananbacteria bacterium RBG_13_36_9]
MPRKNPKRPGLKRPQMICELCGNPVDGLYPDPRYKNHSSENQKFCCLECKRKLEGKGGKDD